MGKGLSVETETRIVALLARNDTYASIKEDTGASTHTINTVRLRNKENLEIIKQKMLIHAAKDAMSIKDKANDKIYSKLERDDKLIEILDKSRQDYMDGEISTTEYLEIVRKTTELSVTELVQVSREMHHQAVAEDPAPPTPADMAALVAAIKSGDETKITQVVFNGQRTPTPETDI